MARPPSSPRWPARAACLVHPAPRSAGRDAGGVGFMKEAFLRGRRKARGVEGEAEGGRGAPGSAALALPPPRLSRRVEVRPANGSATFFGSVPGAAVMLGGG